MCIGLRILYIHFKTRSAFYNRTIKVGALGSMQQGEDYQGALTGQVKWNSFTMTLVVFCT